jgi:hypothetical protein
MGCDHFFTVLSLHGNHPSTPTYLCRRSGGDFLRLAAHEGVRGGPVHSELPLCFGSLSAATSRTLFAQRGTVCSELVFQGYQQTRKKSIHLKKRVLLPMGCWPPSPGGRSGDAGHRRAKPCTAMASYVHRGIRRAGWHLRGRNGDGQLRPPRDQASGLASESAPGVLQRRESSPLEIILFTPRVTMSA